MTTYVGTPAELPENYGRPTVANLMPDQVVHPFHYAVAVDSKSRLYVDTQYGLDDEANEPSYPGTRVGLMRVFFPMADGGPLVDGFVADLRHVKKGDISRELSPEDVVSGRYVPLLAVRVRDGLDGEKTVGDTGLNEALGVLVRACDQIRADQVKPFPGFDLSGIGGVVVRNFPDAEAYPRHSWTTAVPTTLGEEDFSAMLGEGHDEGE